MLLEALIDRWPGVFGESPAQREANMRTGQKPEWLSWEEWADHRRPGYWRGECHWYDREHVSHIVGGHCTGALPHNHQPRIMKWYWNRWTRVFTWPLMAADGVAEMLSEARWVHRWVLRHTITGRAKIEPTRIEGGIAVYEQDTFRAPMAHQTCGCGQTWYR